MLLLSTLSLCLACSCTAKEIGVERSDDDWTTICDGDTRYAAQNLKSCFSPLHSILRQKYRVERFSEGSPTSSLCILQVSEAECQGIKSYACVSASIAQRPNVATSSTLSSSLTLVKLMLLLSILSLSHVHPPTVCQQYVVLNAYRGTSIMRIGVEVSA